MILHVSVEVTNFRSRGPGLVNQRHLPLFLICSGCIRPGSGASGNVHEPSVHVGFVQENHLAATYDVQVFTESEQIRHIMDRPSPEAIARLVRETGMGALQARRHLQQRAKLQERAMRSHLVHVPQAQRMNNSPPSPLAS